VVTHVSRTWNDSQHDAWTGHSLQWKRVSYLQTPATSIRKLRTHSQSWLQRCLITCLLSCQLLSHEPRHWWWVRGLRSSYLERVFSRLQGHEHPLNAPDTQLPDRTAEPNSSLLSRPYHPWIWSWQLTCHGWWQPRRLPWWRIAWLRKPDGQPRLRNEHYLTGL